MRPKHHPSLDILTGYAAGILDPGFGLVVAAHLEACAQCRGIVAANEGASGASLADLPDAAMTPDALSRVVARLGNAPAPKSAPDARPLLDRLPLKPRKWVAPGVWVAAVDTPRASENRVYVLSVGPGKPTALHSHSGAEFCTVLAGAYRDQLGVFAAGDFAAAESDLKHQPIVEGDEDCVCLFATEGRLKPNGLLGRIAFSLADV